MTRGLRLTDGIVELRPPRRTDARPLYEAVIASLAELVPWMAWAHAGLDGPDDERELEPVGEGSSRTPNPLRCLDLPITGVRPRHPRHEFGQ